MSLRQPLISAVTCGAVAAMFEFELVAQEVVLLGVRAAAVATLLVAARFGHVMTVWFLLAIALGFEAFHRPTGHDVPPQILILWLTMLNVVLNVVAAVLIGRTRSRLLFWCLSVLLTAQTLLVVSPAPALQEMKTLLVGYLEQMPVPALPGVAAGLFVLVGWRFWRLRRVSDGGMAVTILMIGVATGRPHEADSWIAAAVVSIAVTTLESLFALAYRDGLTGLRSRRSFDETLPGLPTSVCIAMVDIDHFKRVNDRFGHDVGDQVLRKVARDLAECRGSVFRYGGEEFSVIFTKMEVGVVKKELEELRKRVAERQFVVRPPRSKNRRQQKGAAKSLKVTISIGAATRSAKRRRTEDVIKAADRALYRAKRAGRNRVIVVSR